MNLSKVTESYFKEQLFLTAFLQDYKNVVFSQAFEITLSTAGYGCLNNSPITFTTGDP